MVIPERAVKVLGPSLLLSVSHVKPEKNTFPACSAVLFHLAPNVMDGYSSKTFQHQFKQINLSSEEGVDAETVNKPRVLHVFYIKRSPVYTNLLDHQKLLNNFAKWHFTYSPCFPKAHTV
eukprot:sb/3476157/